MWRERWITEDLKDLNRAGDNRGLTVFRYFGSQVVR